MEKSPSLLLDLTLRTTLKPFKTPSPLSLIPSQDSSEEVQAAVAPPKAAADPAALAKVKADLAKLQAEVGTILIL